MLYYRGLSYILEIIWSELMSQYQYNPLASYFKIDQTQDLIAKKYYWSTLYQDVEVYVKSCNVCLASKAIWHKRYENLLALPVPSHRSKDLSMDFVTELPVSTNWKGKSYDLIFVIVDRLAKMMQYKPMKITIDTPSLAKVIINIVVWLHSLSDSIIIDWCSLFTSKHWSLLCNFLEIKKKLFMAFHPQINSQTER